MWDAPLSTQQNQTGENSMSTGPTLLTLLAYSCYALVTPEELHKFVAEFFSNHNNICTQEYFPHMVSNNSASEKWTITSL